MEEAGDEAALETELEAHLEENRASLQAVEEALAADMANSELIAVREELHQAVKGAEENLLHLKRARLFREVDAMAQPQELPFEPRQTQAPNEVHLSDSRPDPADVASVQPFPVGSKCRFRHCDGRWYNGCVISIEDDSMARVSFLHPTSEKMQEQCRFGAKCRLSHGTEIQLSALRVFKPPEWKHISLGSAVLAEAGKGLWRAAELESWDEAQRHASIVFSADGRRVEVVKDDLAVSEYASASDVSGISDDEEEYPSDDDIDEAHTSLGTFFGAVSGVQTETVTFAHWERHTRGVASKMMASMGFREGMGLGKSGQGITQPVKVTILPSKQSLEFVKENQDGTQGVSETAGRKKSRGGKRKREQKWAAAQRAAKSKMEVMEEKRNVFDFINHQLTAQQGTDAKSSSSGGLPGAGGQSGSEKQSLDKASRHTIVAHEDEIKDLRGKVSKLQEMATRNRREKSLYEAVGRKLVEARKALASAEAAHATTMDAVHSKEKERKWLRF